MFLGSIRINFSGNNHFLPFNWRNNDRYNVHSSDSIRAAYHAFTPELLPLLYY